MMEEGSVLLGEDVEAVSEIIKDRLYFVTYSKKQFHPPPTRAPCHLFNIDDQLVYNNFFADFGPLHIGHLYRYWVLLNEKLKSSALVGKKIIHWTTTDPRKRANAAFLIGAFAVVQLKMAPKDVYRCLLSIKHPYTPFQDASVGVSQYKIRLLDCLNAINKAFYYGIVRFDDFDLASYDFYEKVENGDLNWIVPAKLLALSGRMEGSEFGCSLEYYIDYFKKKNITDVIRLNKASYEINKFHDNGIQVHDMFFSDGSAPGKSIVYKFFTIVENTQGTVAVHCKAGLGRTGCLIGAYLVKHYKMTACEAIAWLRICRPGCVIGHQQTWLERCEKYLHRSGELYRLRRYGDADKMPLHQFGIYSIVKTFRTKDDKELNEAVVTTGKILQSDRKRSSLMVVGQAASAVGASVGRLMAGLRRSTGSNIGGSSNWGQGELLSAKKWQLAQAKPSKLIIKKRSLQDNTASSK